MFFLFNSISISPLRLHSASSVQIPSSTRKLNTMLPSIKKRPLNILSASSINLHGIANRNVFHSILGLDCLVYNYLFFVNTLIRSKRCVILENNQSDDIEAFNSSSRYLDDVLYIDNNFFDNMVKHLFSSELQ